MFAQNIKPTTIPPYNRGVLALVVLLGITMIVTFCGMSGAFQKFFPVPGINFGNTFI